MKNRWLTLLFALCTICLLFCSCSSSNSAGNPSVNHSEPAESKIEDIIGDWYGTTEVHSDRNEGTFTAVLSINPDGHWASCVNGSVNSGTWEASSDSTNRLILTVEYKGGNFTNTWSFEKKTDGKYYYNYVYGESIPISVTKMETESAEQLLGDWQGNTIHTFEDGEEKQFDASLSINADLSWSSSVNGSNNAGHWDYISEAGHLVVLTVEYSGGTLTNTWAFTKDDSGQYHYEYVHGEAIRIPVVNLSQ